MDIPILIDDFLKISETGVLGWLKEIFTYVTSLYGIVMFLRNYLTRTVNLSIGSFKIKQKYYDVQNITNIVSVRFYEGGQIPAEIRREILNLTCPDIKEISMKKVKTD